VTLRESELKLSAQDTSFTGPTRDIFDDWLLIVASSCVTGHRRLMSHFIQISNRPHFQTMAEWIYSET
jgi:hypothetical protein